MAKKLRRICPSCHRNYETVGDVCAHCAASKAKDESPWESDPTTEEEVRERAAALRAERDQATFRIGPGIGKLRHSKKKIAEAFCAYMRDRASASRRYRESRARR